MHSENDEATRTRALALWVDTTMTRHATLAQRAMRMRHALYLTACGVVLAMGGLMGTMLGPVI